MSISKVIENILSEIKAGYYFDSHFIIQRIMGKEEYTDQYIRFSAQFAESDKPTFTTHQQIGQQIAKFEGDLVERQKG